MGTGWRGRFADMCVQKQAMRSAGMPGVFFPPCLIIPYPLKIWREDKRLVVQREVQERQRKNGKGRGKTKLMRYSTRTIEERHEGSFSYGLGG